MCSSHDGLERSLDLREAMAGPPTCRLSKPRSLEHNRSSTLLGKPQGSKSREHDLHRRCGNVFQCKTYVVLTTLQHSLFATRILRVGKCVCQPACVMPLLRYSNF